MATKNKGVVGIIMFVTTLDTIIRGRVEGLKFLDKSNFGPKPKGTFKTIEVPEDGDMIDCVDIYKQPAFRNTLVKDLKLAPSPSCLNLFNKSIPPQPNLIQNWHKYGECPEGTIPIRRMHNNEGNDHRKAPNYETPKNREYAAAYDRGSIYHGAGAKFSLWNPQVRGTNEFSLSQMWIVSGRHPPINTIEAGWIVYPAKFHDTKTRIFIFWTGDGYNKTGCYNLDCEGFVQTDRRIVLGGSVGPYSVYDGAPYEISINVVRNVESNDWWLQILGVVVGYFDHRRFTSLHLGADLTVGFGGEIVNRKYGNRHTATQMGSGHFPSEEYKKAGFIRNIMIVNDKYKNVDASLSSRVTRPECYDLHFGPPETTWNSHFYFGGPGYSHRCA